MNVYDFDQTIFYPDSSYSFTNWYLNRHPLVGIVSAPVTALYGIFYLSRLVSKESFKEKIFAYVRYIDDIDSEIQRFWDEYEHRLCKWYLRQRRDDDLIISASPEFVIRPIAERLGIDFIATDMDRKTGKIYGRNCSGEEKVRRFRERFPDAKVEAFYSDSLSDTPMAKVAEKAYRVIDKGQKLIPWPNI